MARLNENEGEPVEILPPWLIRIESASNNEFHDCHFLGTENRDSAT